MTLAPRLKEAVKKVGDAPVRVEDTETRTAYLIVREDVYLWMCELSAVPPRIACVTSSGNAIPIHEDHPPFTDRPSLVTVRGEAVEVYRNQIDSMSSRIAKAYSSRGARSGS